MEIVCWRWAKLTHNTVGTRGLLELHFLLPYKFLIWTLVYSGFLLLEELVLVIYKTIGITYSVLITLKNPLVSEVSPIFLSWYCLFVDFPFYLITLTLLSTFSFITLGLNLLNYFSYLVSFPISLISSFFSPYFLWTYFVLLYLVSWIERLLDCLPAGVAHLVEHLPMHQEIMSSIPGQSTCGGCGLNPQ